MYIHQSAIRPKRQVFCLYNGNNLSSLRPRNKNLKEIATSYRFELYKRGHCTQNQIQLRVKSWVSAMSWSGHNPVPDDIHWQILNVTVLHNALNASFYPVFSSFMQRCKNQDSFFFLTNPVKVLSIENLQAIRVLFKWLPLQVQWDERNKDWRSKSRSRPSENHCRRRNTIHNEINTGHWRIVTIVGNFFGR